MAAELVSTLAAWIVTYAIHGTLILALVALIVRCAVLPERVEERLWRFALVAGLATATVQLALGHAPFTAVAVGQPELHAFDLPALEIPEPLAPEPTPAEAAPAAASADTAAEAPVASPSPSLPAAAGIVLLACLLAGVGLARLGVRRLALRRLLRDRRRLVDGSDARVALGLLCERAGVRERVVLSVSGELDAPVAFGIWRPEICVPRRALHELSPASRDAMLAHEVAHVMRRDPLVLEIGHTLCAIFPWQPLLRVALRRLRALAEFRCDAIGARLTAAVDVADCLVEVAGWLCGDGRRVAVAEGLVGMTVHREGLAARVDRLLACELPAERPPARARTLAGSLLALGALSATLPGAAVDAAGPPVVPAVLDAPAPPAAAAPSAWGELLAELDVERHALGRELQALRAEAADWLPEAELGALLDALERRLASIDHKRAALGALLDAPPTAMRGSARTIPTPKLETSR